MERATGLEPATSSLGSLRSTTELCPLEASSRRQCNGEGGRGQEPENQSRADLVIAVANRSQTAILGDMNGSGKNREGANRSEHLYFFPDQKETAEEARHMLRQGTAERRARVTTHRLAHP